MSKYHDILGVSADADEKTVKQAYRKLASQHHPDKGGDEAKFKEVQEAYERITDPEKFAKEDPFSGFKQQQGRPRGAFWHHAGDEFMHVNFEELLRRQQATLRMRFEIELESTLHDQQRSIHMPEHHIPPMEITIPAGIRHGESMQYKIPSVTTTTNDRMLVIQFVVRPHKDFHIVDHLHLLRSEKVSALDAMAGTTLTVTTIDGAKLNVKVPPGSQNGTKLKIPAKGLKYKEDPNYRGDMFVNIEIVIPTLTDDERKIITDLRDNKK